MNGFPFHSAQSCCLQVSPMQPVMGAVIGALTGSDDPNEVAVMAKQASEVEISD